MELIRKNKPLFIMMVGLAGSGKSTFAEDIVVNYNNMNSKPALHSSDKLRLELYGDEQDQKHNQDVFNELHKRIKTDLNNGRDVIYDATNMSKKRRISFLRELSNIQCEKHCICVMTPYKKCLHFNESRERTIPDGAIKRMYMNWTPPHKSEGFDDIVLLYNGVDKQYSIGELMKHLSNIDQENKHHSLTIGEHCKAALDYIKNKGSDNKNLKIATLMHDIGKEFTKTYINSRGECDGEAHYYQHQNVGAYDSLFYLRDMGLSTDDQLHISNLIYYHMHPYVAWKQSEKAANRDRNLLGQEMFDEIQLLHESDAHAHIPTQNIQLDIEEEVSDLERY